MQPKKKLETKLDWIAWTFIVMFLVWVLDAVIKGVFMVIGTNAWLAVPLVCVGMVVALLLHSSISLAFKSVKGNEE